MYGEVYRVEVRSGTSQGFSILILENGYMNELNAKLEMIEKDGSTSVKPGELVVVKYLHYYHRLPRSHFSAEARKWIFLHT